MITYRGKLVVADNEQQTTAILPDSSADEIVANNVPFSSYKDTINAGPPYTILTFDDSTPVTLDDTISVNEVPDDAEASFVLEPAYIING